jgi:hypothetical protein
MDSRLCWTWLALTCGTQACAAADSASTPAADTRLWGAGEEWKLSSDPSLTLGALDGPEAIGSVGR